jgi:aminopeptidase N
VRELEGEEAYQKRMQQTLFHVTNTKPIVQGEEVDSDDTYQGDIYGKGAFFMHTLRYVLGDDVFFPTLKKLAVSSRYTYDTLVTTDDVERLFSKESGKSLKPLFDLYLRTIQKVEVNVKQLSDTTYQVRLNNLDGSWPFEVETPQGVKKEMLDKKGITVTSHSWPLIDPKMFYLKRVIQE